jgi:hypothetical protein
MDTHRPPHFDGTNFPYYSARMACYLEAVDLGVWRVTRDGMKPLKNPEKPTTSEEKEIHLNARAKNCLYESLSMDCKRLARGFESCEVSCRDFVSIHSGSQSLRLIGLLLERDSMCWDISTGTYVL